MENQALNILLVDDEPDILGLLRDALHERGHRITAANDGAEAMRQLDERRFDLAVCDVRLPDASGLEILRRIRREQEDSRVVLMSAFGDVSEAVLAMKEEALDYLKKPFAIEQLLAIVGRVAGSRAVLDRVHESEAASSGRGADRDAARVFEPLPPLSHAIRDFERGYLVRALHQCEWQRTRTSAMLGISRKTLWQKLRMYGVSEAGNR